MREVELRVLAEQCAAYLCVTDRDSAPMFTQNRRGFAGQSTRLSSLNLPGSENAGQVNAAEHHFQAHAGKGFAGLEAGGMTGGGLDGALSHA